MAIFSHKWLMLWRKKHIVINLSWHGGYGPLLSSFEVLEVSKTHNSSIVWRHHSKSPVPLTPGTLIFGQMLRFMRIVLHFSWNVAIYALCRILAEMSRFTRFARHKFSADRHLKLFCTPDRRPHQSVPPCPPSSLASPPMSPPHEHCNHCVLHYHR